MKSKDFYLTYCSYDYTYCEIGYTFENKCKKILKNCQLHIMICKLCKE